jgi:hypothetical protein
MSYASLPLSRAVKRLDQYREPLCNELSGQNVTLRTQTGGACTFHFVTYTNVTFTGLEGTPLDGAYECLKLRDSLYLLSLTFSSGAPGMGAVLDLRTGFAFLGHGAGAGEVCRLAGTAWPGEAFAAPTQELAGHTLLWRCGARERFAHTYETASTLRLTYADPSGEAQVSRSAAVCYPVREDVYMLASGDAREGRLWMVMDLCAIRAVGLSLPPKPRETEENKPTLFCSYGVFLPPEQDIASALLTDDTQKYKDRVVGREPYNPVAQQPATGGLKQYAYPGTGELAGQVITLLMDGQPPATVHFLDAATLEWAWQGEAYKQETYDCVKGADDVYMVVCHPHSQMPASCVTLVWDRATRLTTVVLAHEHRDPAHPRMVISQAYFGVEGRPGMPLPTQRHTLTDELVGKRILWHYTPTEDVLHICYSPTHFRLGAAHITLAPVPSQAALNNYQRLINRKAKYPYYEEKVYYIRLRENLHLYSVIEYAMCLLLENQGGGELLVLMDAAREHYIGRTFGLDAQQNAGHDIVGAPGCFLDTPDEVEALPFPIYDVE